MFWAQAGDFAAAIDAYTAGVALHPTGRTLATLLTNRAASHIALRRLCDALDDCFAAVAAAGEHVRAHTRAAAVLLRVGALAPAKRRIDAARALDPAAPGLEDTAALWARANAALSAAAPATSAAWNVNPHTGAVVAAEAPLPDGVLQHWEQLLQLLPDAAQLRVQYATALFVNRRHVSAVRHARLAVDTAAALGLRADAVAGDDALRVWDADAAVTVLAHALSATGDVAAASAVATGPLQGAMRRLADAKTAANEAYKTGNVQAAFDAFVAADADAMEALGHRVAAFRSNAAAAVMGGAAGGDRAVAAAHCTAALAAHPWQPKVLLRRARCKAATGDVTGAAADAAVAQYLQPDAADAVELLRGAPPTVVHVHSVDEWREQVRKAGDRPIVCDFYADWCGPCRAIAPTFEELSATHPAAVFVKVNADDQGTASLAADAKVRSLPTFKVYRGGVERDALLGADEPQLRGLVARAMAWRRAGDVDVDASVHLSGVTWPPGWC